MNARARRGRGFTLIEVMLVIVIVAVGAGVVSLALRDSASSRLEHEATRLAALLDAARAEARATGLPVRWEVASADNSEGAHFRFVGLPPSAKLPKRWLHDDVQARVVGARAVRLGPEPMIGAQRIVLTLDQRELVLATDGLGPFEPVAAQTP